MPGGITPNGSMRWFVRADRKDNETDEKNGKWTLKGKDRTLENGFFKVVIGLPSLDANRLIFLGHLLRHVGEALADKSIRAITLCMPLEDATSGYKPPQDTSENYDPDRPGDWQVYVDWATKKDDLPEELREGWVSPSGSAI